MRCVMPVHMRLIRLEATQILMHHLNLCLQQFILLMCFPNIFRVSLQALDLLMQGALVVLCAADILDRYNESALP